MSRTTSHTICRPPEFEVNKYLEERTKEPKAAEDAGSDDDLVANPNRRPAQDSEDEDESEDEDD